MANPKKIVFRGVPMIEGWPEKILAAQQIASVKINGRDVPRIRYGDEQDDWGANEHTCHDCSVLKGEFHVPGCDGEECPICSGQMLSCDCALDNEPE